MSALAPGTRVFASWLGGGFAPGAAVEVNPVTGLVKVRFDDGREAWVSAMNVRVAPAQTAERALYHLSRHPPRLACEAIAEAAAPLTDPEATEFGLLALTTFGDKCRPALPRLVDDPKATPQARGSALEILGAIGDPQLAQRIARATAASKPAVERARSWLRARP